MKPTLSYSLARFGLLGVVFAIGYLVGLRGVVLIVVAFLGSSVISFFLLNNARNEMGENVGNYFERLNAKIDQSSRKEDLD